MKTEIYYFTGTGNSLFIANKLHKLLPDTVLIPIVKLLKSNHHTTKASNIGFIFPCHGLTIPIPVKDFLKRVDPKSSDYFFAIATRAGSVFRGFHLINQLLRKKSKHLNADFVINMGLNDPKLKEFSVPTKEELNALEKNALHKLKEIQKIIKDKAEYHEDENGVTFSCSRILNYPLERLIHLRPIFYHPW